ncbi:hypothetical protein [Cerasicoccus maritimus]|uniref:hypothetical protein n=1 Tax=Cerasicoccus maritimus TaxID=490089 RepID=UPI002852C851|nr:hypothetical protein [Cerasicoccus maritimus]
MSHEKVSADGQYYNPRQAFFVRYFCLVMTDIVVLNLFAEYWHRVHVTSFTDSILAALILQMMVKVTLKFEHMVSDSFKGKSGLGQAILKKFCLWLVLFGSKFAILWALATFVGEEVHFDGKMHGIVPLIVLIVVMIAAEFLVSWLTDILGDEPRAKKPKHDAEQSAEA